MLVQRFFTLLPAITVLYNITKIMTRLSKVHRYST